MEYGVCGSAGRGRARKEQGPPSDKSLKSDVRRLTTQRAFSARQMLALITIATGLVLSPHFTPLTRRCQSNASPHEPRARTRLSRNKGACVVPNIFGGKYQTFRKRDALTFRNVMSLQITACAALLHMHATSLGEVEFP